MKKPTVKTTDTLRGPSKLNLRITGSDRTLRVTKKRISASLRVTRTVIGVNHASASSEGTSTPL